MELITRNATLSDIPFLVETIIEAEKSGTSILSYTTIFGLEEADAKKYIGLMLDEEIDDCELSVSAFFVAEIDGKTVGAVCAWVEEANGVPSTTLKGNLLRFTLPESSFQSIHQLNHIIKELHIEYIPNTIQIGLVYVSEEARGKGLVQRLLSEKIQQLKSVHQNIGEVYVQVFGHNLAAIKAYEKIDFQTINCKIAKSNDIINYLPSSTKIVMKLNLK
jgi:ribosomal protein S18 acetylase RimI-like enzyme